MLASYGKKMNRSINKRPFDFSGIFGDIGDVFPSWTMTHSIRDLGALASDPYKFEVIDGRHIMTYDVPGVKRSDINLIIEDDVLMLSFTRDNTKVEKRFRLQTEYDVAKTTSTLADGVLRIELVPLTTRSATFKVEIK